MQPVTQPEGSTPPVSTPAAPSGKPRNAALDIAKGFGILTVVITHIPSVVNGEPMQIAYVMAAFNMALFLFISGLLLDTRASFATYTLSRAIGMLKPYFLVLVGLTAFYALVAWLRHVPLEPSLSKQLLGIAEANGRSIKWVPMWYLPHAFLASVLSWVVIRSWQKQSQRVWPVVITSLVLLAAGAYLLKLALFLPWTADALGISTAFVLWGYASKQRALDVSNFPRWLFWSAVAVFVGFQVFWDEYIDINERVYGQFLITTAQAALGIYITMGLSHWLAANAPRWLRQVLGVLGSGTLVILIFHSFFIGKVLTLGAKLNIPIELTSVIAILAGLIGPLLVWEVVKRNRWLLWIFMPYIRKPSASSKPT